MSIIASSTRELLCQFNAKTYDGCLNEFVELMYELDSLGAELHQHVLTLSVINPQLCLIAQLVRELSTQDDGICIASVGEANAFSVNVL